MFTKKKEGNSIKRKYREIMCCPGVSYFLVVN